MLTTLPSAGAMTSRSPAGPARSGSRKNATTQMASAVQSTAPIHQPAEPDARREHDSTTAIDPGADDEPAALGRRADHAVLQQRDR